jgi:hypothetical protein
LPDASRFKNEGRPDNATPAARRTKGSGGGFDKRLWCAQNRKPKPALTALAIALFALSGAALFAGGNLSAGVREDRGNRWVMQQDIGLAHLAAECVLIVFVDDDRREIQRS